MNPQRDKSEKQEKKTRVNLMSGGGGLKLITNGLFVCLKFLLPLRKGEKVCHKMSLRIRGRAQSLTDVETNVLIRKSLSPDPMIFVSVFFFVVKRRSIQKS